MLRGLSMHAAPLALAVMWPPFCDLPPLPGDGSGGGDTGGNSSQGGATGGGGAGTGGSSGDAGDPVLGCAAPEWPSKAALVPLPPVEFDDLVWQPQLPKLSANGEVVVASYVIDLDLSQEPDRKRPIFWNGGDWQWIDADTTGIPTAVSCDGSVIAGRRSLLDAFIKKADTPLVVVPGEEPWAAIPEDLSADGTRIGGNMTSVQEGPEAGQTIPVWWTLAGETWFLDPPEPRTLRHVSYDGSLVAGHRNICYSGHFCGALASLFVSPLAFDETLYADMPWSVMSSDFSTSTGATLPPLYHWGDGNHEVLLFRRPDQLTQVPCPTEAECDAVAISSRGNIVLVRSLGASYIWTAEHGFRDIVGLLAANGAVFSELSFDAVDMSDDGRVILGSGRITYENGEQEERWFRAFLPRRVYEGTRGDASDSTEAAKARR